MPLEECPSCMLARHAAWRMEAEFHKRRDTSTEAMKAHFLPSLLLWLMVQGSIAGGVAVHFSRPLETVAPFNIILFISSQGSPPGKLIVDVFSGPEAECDGEEAYNHTELLLETPPQWHALQVHLEVGTAWTVGSYLVCAFLFGEGDLFLESFTDRIDVQVQDTAYWNLSAALLPTGLHGEVDVVVEVDVASSELQASDILLLQGAQMEVFVDGRLLAARSESEESSEGGARERGKESKWRALEWRRKTRLVTWNQMLDVLRRDGVTIDEDAEGRGVVGARHHSSPFLK